MVNSKKQILSVFLWFSLFGINSLFAIDVKWEQQIPMRDGVHLSADIYFPSDVKEKLPVILTITPYVADSDYYYGTFYTDNNYIFIAVDSRGRGNSEGEFMPFLQDGKDGYDVIEWIAAQPFCDGRVAMTGASYEGMTQWLTLKNLPKALTTIVPTASVGPGIDFPKGNNIFYKYGMRWLSLVEGRTSNRKIMGREYWDAKFEDSHEQHLPFAQIDESFIGKKHKAFQQWIKHPEFDDYWKNILPLDEEFAQMDIPILSVTGYFDGDQDGAMFYYQKHKKVSDNGNHYLIIGPWDHSGTLWPSDETGGLKFGKNAKFNMLNLHLDWFNWVLRDSLPPEFLKDKVAYYEMQSNEWKYTDELEVKGQKQFYLQKAKPYMIDSVRYSGKLVGVNTFSSENDTLVHDPLVDKNKAVTIKDYIEKDSYSKKWYLMGEDRLVYVSSPLEDSITIFGRLHLEISMKLSTPDTDIQAYFVEKTTSGEYIHLGSGTIRAKYRNSLEKAEPVMPEDINLYRINSRVTCREISKGSQIIVAFSYLNSFAYQHNLNSGGDVSFETAADAQTAILEVYYDEQHPSRLIIDVK